MYVYAGNDPINRIDPTGEIWPIDGLLCLYYEWRAADAIKDCTDRVTKTWSSGDLESICEMPGPSDQYWHCLQDSHREDVAGMLKYCAGLAAGAMSGSMSGQPGAVSVPGRIGDFKNHFPGP